MNHQLEKEEATLLAELRAKKEELENEIAAFTAKLKVIGEYREHSGSAQVNVRTTTDGMTVYVSKNFGEVHFHNPCSITARGHSVNIR